MIARLEHDGACVDLQITANPMRAKHGCCHVDYPLVVILASIEECYRVAART